MNLSKNDSLAMKLKLNGEKKMPFSIRIKNNTIVIEENTPSSMPEIWTKNLKDLILNRSENTTLSMPKNTPPCVLFWQPVGEHILLVFSKGGFVRCMLATKNAAYLRLIERINEAVSVSLSKKGLEIVWMGAIINIMDADISDAQIRIGNRLAVSFTLPVFSGKISKEQQQKQCVHHFYFPLQDIMKNQNELHSRIQIAVTINGYTVLFPMKMGTVDNLEEKYKYVPITSFYLNGYALQLKYSSQGNIAIVCRPMQDIEYSRRFLFLESPIISGSLYRIGCFFKKHSSKKLALFYEKFSEKAEEGTYEIFLEAQKRNPSNAFFIINKKSKDYEQIKDNPNVVPQFSLRYYWLLFRASTYISTEAPIHLHILRSNNKFFRKSIVDNDFVFLQHGITYLKCQGKNSVFVAGRESEPSYIIVDSEKEKKVVSDMLHLPSTRILKTGMAIFSKIQYKHLSQFSDDIAVIMLTWKPYELCTDDFTMTSYYQNTLGIYKILHQYLPDEQIKIVIHPKTRADLENTPLAPFVWQQPISEVLSVAKLLITDYSSVCYNSFYQGGGVVFFQEDLAHYEKENGRLIPKDDEYIGKRAFSLEELETILQEGLENGKILLEQFRTKEFEQRYHSINEFSDGKNIERICDSLKKLKLL